VNERAFTIIDKNFAFVLLVIREFDNHCLRAVAGRATALKQWFFVGNSNLHSLLVKLLKKLCFLACFLECGGCVTPTTPHWRLTSTEGTNSGVADLMDDFERETFGFTFKIIPLLSNAQIPNN
jgi:hypothetical protein